MVDNRQQAPAAARNRELICQVLATLLPASGLVLEVASGSGEHAVYFARQFPHLIWQPSDPKPAARESITAWIEHEKLENVRPPLDLDVRAPVWPVEAADAIICINMIHVAPWEAALGLLAGAGRILSRNGMLYLYGAYFIRGRETAPSNVAFDQSLRGRNSEWGVRELDEVTDASKQCGLFLDHVVDMPANNYSVIFRRA